MKISIIIPLYNSEEYIGNCIDSLLKQDLSTSEYELIIIDDGSTDKSLDIANNYTSEYSNITIKTKPNGGVGSARNLGLTLAKGDYIYFLDSDDYLLPNVLGGLYDLVSVNDLEILTFKSNHTKKFNEDSGVNKLDEDSLSDIVDGIDYISQNKYNNEVWWYIIKRSFLNETGFTFIENGWMEDAIFTTQLFLEAKRMAKISNSIHRHLVSKESAMTNKEPKHYIDVINGNKNAALFFERLISFLPTNKRYKPCIGRLKTRQQSFVFFMMLRIWKSTLPLKTVKKTIEELSLTHSYPLNNFLGKDYNGLSYVILTTIFNNKKLYFLLFRILNPFLR